MRFVFAGLVKSGTGNSGDKINVWIDYNNDGDFIDTGERIYTGSAASFLHTANITIPASGPVLNTPVRMRVAGYDSWKASPTTDPCVIGSYDGYAGTYNEIEDYAVLIKTTPPLPVELLSFNAVLETPAVKLLWETASEKNVSHFIVERTTPNDSQWSPIDRLKAKGGNAMTNYYCYDPSPAKGLNYYRLQSIDNDGTTSTSKIISVDLSQQGDFKIWPVPVQNTLSISIDVDIAVNRDQIVCIRNLNGQELIKTAFHVNIVSIDVSKLAAGVYIVEVSAAGKVMTKKFVKQ